MNVSVYQADIEPKHYKKYKSYFKMTFHSVIS